MVANLVNMIVTLNHFEKNSNKIGPKGPKGQIGRKGFKGKSDTCGAYNCQAKTHVKKMNAMKTVNVK